MHAYFLLPVSWTGYNIPFFGDNMCATKVRPISIVVLYHGKKYVTNFPRS